MYFNVHGVVDVGPILAGDSDSGALVTAHGDPLTLTLWVHLGDDTWMERDTRLIGVNGRSNLYGIYAGELLDKAREYLDEKIADGSAEDVS